MIYSIAYSRENTMRIITTLIFILSHVSLWAQISTIHSLKEAENDMNGLNSKSLVLFDVDDVLIVPKDPIFRSHGKYRPQSWVNLDPQEKDNLTSIMLAGTEFILVETYTPSFIRSLQKNGVKTLGLTAARTGKYGVIEDTVEWRIDQLLQHKINFGAFLGTFTFPDLVSPEANPPVFKRGILFLGDFSRGQKSKKGDLLTVFLDKIQWSPEKVVFFDDKLDNLLSVEEAMKEKNIPFHGYHYMGTEALPGIFDAQVAEVQYKYVIEKKLWLDDQQATAVAMIKNYFLEKAVSITPLMGGYSEAMNLRVDGKYVLRVPDTMQTEKSILREFFAMKDADLKGVGPHIHHVGFNNKAILMDYIEGGTLTMEQAKRSENCIKIAQSLRKAHASARNPISRSPYKDKIEALYEELRGYVDNSHITKAIELIRDLHKEPKEGALPKVNIHGDLNARNIFITDKGALFIDWSQTNWEDPFYDLSCFAIMHDYDDALERLLLENYLEHPPTKSQKKHYERIKKINLAQLCLTCHYVMHELLQKKPQKIDENAALKPWSHYAYAFAGYQSGRDPQFFYEAGASALKKVQDEINFKSQAQE